ncbi:3-oxoacyl-ACP synthase [Arcticibacterium luteifluviistationis]|uniref:3-oxoacyl-ACP synthase n=1 Tax=Arcticibacterium luteifluviistationis TaxID=1784714 RepID=A0A2Z4GDH3_9BACT|nr:3-oxoacyl-ACP synthase [Arcticibacterium luteifluviistationis]AWV99167.1 3-oxoacyl-ACP synthase [Arcticibacterium luteifluviistationis]
MGNYIKTAEVIIAEGKVRVNNEVVFQFDDSQENSVFLKEIYKDLDLAYPKFYKMDELCKLGVLAAEYLMRSKAIDQNYKPEDVALILSNSSSSLSTDTKHQESISDKDAYFPSPAVFVYTLANIVLGEIAIKFKFTGEQSFFIFEDYDATFMESYAHGLLDNSEAECVIAGWVEIYENNYKAILYTIEKAS